MPNNSTTKFPAVAIGQCFVWRGRRFVKTGPLLACADDDGRSQMIPRSALVELADGAATAAAATDCLRTAVDGLRQTALDQIDALAADPTAPTAAGARAAIEAAYTRVLQQLNPPRR